jgi:hypothetical protein
MYEEIHLKYVLIEEQNLYQSYLMHGRQVNEKKGDEIYYYVTQKQEFSTNLPGTSKWPKGNH